MLDGPMKARVLVVDDDATVADVAVEVDLSAHEVRVGGEPVALTAREFDLLAFLMRHPGVAFRREELLERVWGYTFGDTSTVTVHVRRLREKIEPSPSDPALIRTVWGVGYRFDVPVDGERWDVERSSPPADQADG